jgi:hypothetical protein
MSLILLIVIFFASLIIGNIFTGGTSESNQTLNPVSLLIGAGVLALLVPIHWLLGWALNSKRTPSGRHWHNQHTFEDMPIQYMSIPQMVFALMFAAGGLGLLTSALYGWLLLGGGLVVMAVGGVLWRNRRKR